MLHSHVFHMEGLEVTPLLPVVPHVPVHTWHDAFVHQNLSDAVQYTLLKALAFHRAGCVLLGSA